MLWLTAASSEAVWRQTNKKTSAQIRRLSSCSASLAVIWLDTFLRIEGNAKTKDHQSDRRGSHWSSWHGMNALPSHVRSYLVVRFPVLLLCVNRHRSVRLLCCLHRRGRKRQKRRGVYIRNECERCRLPELFHTSSKPPHPPVDEGPRVQCGALPP